jgi:integrase
LSGKSVPRICGDQTVHDGTIHISAIPKFSSASGNIFSADPSIQKEYLKKVRRMLSGKTQLGLNRVAIRQQIRELIQKEPLSQINHLLFEWSCSLLTHKASTVLRYLGAIGNYLILAFENEEFVEQEPAWFESHYEQVLATIKRDKERSYARKTLGRFHGFLTVACAVPDIGRGFFSSKVGPAEYTVDANLVTCAEFDRIKRVLGGDNPQRCHTATAALIIAILGFRCGLRRNEAYYLRVRDIQGGQYPEIVLRPYSKRGLKSGSSTRRIPLYILLCKDELDLMMAWHAERSGNGNAPLFSVMSGSFTMYKPEQLFGPIREAIQQVTADESLHFHHLRHSFTNWMFIRLNGEAGRLRSCARFLDHSEFDDDRVQQLRKTLLGNETLGRKGSYATSLLLGHAEPVTTFKNYIHICDFMLGAQLRQNDSVAALDIHQLSNLSGIPEPTLYKFYHKTYGMDLHKILLIALKKAGVMESASTNIAFDSPDVVIDFRVGERLENRWMAVIRAMTLFQKNLIPVIQISEELGYPVDTIQEWISNANYLANRKVPGTHGSYRHRVVAKYLELFGHDSEGRELWKVKENIAIKCYYRIPRHSNGPRAKIIGERSKVWKKSISQQVHPDHFPVPPRQASDRDLTQRIMTAFESLPENERNFIFDFADIFCENYVSNAGGIWYDNIAGAKRHIQISRLLGIPISHLQLLDFDTKTEKPEEAKKRRNDWEKALDIKNATWISSEERNSMKRITCNIGIRILAVNGGKNSYGFRYAMYLIRIGYWA